MPRRHRSARERPAPEAPRPPRGVAPAWAHLAGHTVWEVDAKKGYRCPGCNQTIHPGARHLVVFPQDEPDLRQHWHTPCWRSELKLRR